MEIDYFDTTENKYKRVPQVEKDFIMLVITDREELDNAMRICLAWANGRNAQWISIPIMDEYGRGYLGLKLGGDISPEVNTEYVYNRML